LSEDILRCRQTRCYTRPLPYQWY